MNRTKRSTKIPKAGRTLRIGFLPENDCAPVVVAHELGLFEDFELQVQLSREATCTTLRDRIINGELDAAHAPATLPFVLSLGLDFEQRHCVSGLVLSLQGNAITLSQELWQAGVRDAGTLRKKIFADWGRRTYTFGVVFPYSPQYFLLCQWLRSAGIIPHSHVRIVVIPPEQMFSTLKLRYLDGFCVGEPWTSVAIEAAVGMSVTTSAQLAPLHPEKVLIVRADFATEQAEEHARLIAALREACAYCERPENRESICEMLAATEYVNAPVECIRAGLPGGSLMGANLQSLAGLNIFSHHHANDPSENKTAWITKHLSQLLRPGDRKSGRLPLLNHIFRRDIFRESQKFARRNGGVKSKPAGAGLPLLAETLCAHA